MPVASHSLRIRAPRESVWSALSDPMLVPDWVYGARKIEFVTDARSGVGAQWRQTNVYGPVVLVLLYEITRADEPTAWNVETVSRPHAEVRHTLEDAPDETGEAMTRLTVEMEYEMPFGAVGRATEPALGEFIGKTITRRSAEALKRLVEKREQTKRDQPPVVP